MGKKQNILVAGAGKIGTILASLLANTDDYSVYLVDKNIEAATEKVAHLSHLELIQCDVLDHKAMSALFKSHSFHAVVSSLPYYCNISIVTLAKEFQCHYFDLTEDIETVRQIDVLAKDVETAFVPQCGIAPGFINIVTHDLIQQFDRADEVKLRCGALPAHTSNTLGYALTWSTEGLINEYDNPCLIIENGEVTDVRPLSEREDLQIDGLNYEAFHTSGGIGSLAETYAGKVNSMNYKSIRYPGHCEKMRFLMQELKLKDDRETLKKILENALPYTMEDVVIMYVSVQGMKNKEPIRKTYTHKFYPTQLANIECSAIQATTTSSACAIIDIVMNQPDQYQGRIKQEAFNLSDLLDNRFAAYLKKNPPKE